MAAQEIVSKRLLITVQLDSHEVLQFDGRNAKIHIIPFEEQSIVTRALSEAISLFIAQQPDISPLATAVDSIEKLALQVNSQEVQQDILDLYSAVREIQLRIKTAVNARTVN